MMFNYYNLFYFWFLAIAGGAEGFLLNLRLEITPGKLGDLIEGRVSNSSRPSMCKANAPPSILLLLPLTTKTFYT